MQLHHLRPMMQSTYMSQITILSQNTECLLCCNAFYYIVACCYVAVIGHIATLSFFCLNTRRGAWLLGTYMLDILYTPVKNAVQKYAR